MRWRELLSRLSGGHLFSVPHRRHPILKGGMALALLLAVLVTAQALIQVTQTSRQQQVRLQTLQGEQDALQVEWGRLLLEQGALASPARIERLAREKLNLYLPDPHDIQVREP